MLHKSVIKNLNLSKIANVLQNLTTTKNAATVLELLLAIFWGILHQSDICF